MSTITKVVNNDSKKDTLSYYIKHHYIPKRGEIIYDDDNNMKIGDGKTRYKDLEYVK
jgi:hypothetical protein